MRKTIIASAVALAAFAVGGEAWAAGLHTGEVLSSGDMIYGEFGFPDISFGFQHGVTNKFDLGFRFSLDYGWEYRTNPTWLGIGMRVPMRLQLFQSGKIAGLLKFEPGIKFDRMDNPLFFGVQFPIGFEMGIKVSPEFIVDFGIDMPFFVNMTNGGYGGIPVLFGFGFEYRVDPSISIGVNSRFGPSVIAANGGSDTALGLIVQGFLTYRL